MINDHDMKEINPLGSEEELVAQLELPVVESQSGRMQVVKSNKLIQAQYSLTATQQKLLSVMIAHVNPTEDYDAIAQSSVVSHNNHSPKVSAALSWRFTKNDIRRVMTIGATNVGPVLLDASKAFRDLSVTYQEVDEKGEVRFKVMNLINEASYDGHEFKISFTPAASRELYNLRDLGYTKYLFENIDNMNNKYAIRLYELIQKLMHPKAKVHVCKFTLSDLYYMLGLSNEQGEVIVKTAIRYADFKRSILMPAIKHVNAKSNMELEVIKEVRKGRKVDLIDIKATRVKFDIPEIITDLIAVEVKEKQAKDWLVLYGEQRIRVNLVYMNNQISTGTAIKNTSAYIKFLLENNIAELPPQANPYSTLYSQDKAAQEFVKLSIMPNWWDFSDDIKKSILQEGITGSIAGQTFQTFKEHYIANSVDEGVINELVQKLGYVI